jgi:photosystem II stability/assembly factor-like uncharacterized protein
MQYDMTIFHAKTMRLIPCICIFLTIPTDRIQAQWEIVFGPLDSNPMNPIERIGGISFVNDSVGYVVGYAYLGPGITNYVIKTTDYANSWDTIFTYTHEPQPFAEFKDVFFIDENTGWVCGSYFDQIFKTTDGGQNWVAYPLPEDTDILVNIEFTDSNYGIAQSESNGNAGAQTFDGGITWEHTNVINGYDVSFQDACNFLTVSAGTITLFESCQPFAQPFPTINEFGHRNGRACYMQDQDNWVLGSMGLIGASNFASILTTNDAGQSFVINDLFFASQVLCFGFIDDHIGYVSVDDADTYPCAVLKTMDGGQTWHCQETPTYMTQFGDVYCYFRDIECPSASVQYACFARGIFRTTNGGGPLGDTYTGVKVQANKPKTVSLYPNPAISIIHLELSDAREVEAIEIYNSVGQQVAVFTGQERFIDVGDWPAGSYTVLVQYENETIHSRFMTE